MFGRMFPEMPNGRNFGETYRCYSVTMLGDREDVERGGKIIMPPSALDKLTRLHIQYPMLFKLTNKKMKRETHCGVLEFMMKNLLLQEGDLVQVDNVSLPIATFAKFQPQHTDFLDISNPKAVLENALRSFACLTVEDLIEFKYNDKVDFAAPLGYKEPERQKPRDTEQEQDMEIFQGKGNRLDGKNKGLECMETQSSNGPPKRGIPNYGYKKNTITFIRNSRKAENGAQSPEDKMFEAFSGDGQSLRKVKTKGRR
ncbi:UFD1-like protein [Mya arenaria]|uniref:UFD1-like protein n=1 Tax=Mya arenaria TaxID=6604 RepID=A0ABY7E3E0_MYAAR|nr:UFD1-like protein [Mya arenaria]